MRLATVLGRLAVLGWRGQHGGHESAGRHLLGALARQGPPAKPPHGPPAKPRHRVCHRVARMSALRWRWPHDTHWAQSTFIFLATSHMHCINHAKFRLSVSSLLCDMLRAAAPVTVLPWWSRCSAYQVRVKRLLLSILRSSLTLQFAPAWGRSAASPSALADRTRSALPLFSLCLRCCQWASCNRNDGFCIVL